MNKYVLVCTSLFQYVPPCIGMYENTRFGTLLSTRRYRAFPLNPVDLNRQVQGRIKPLFCLVPVYSGVQDADTVQVPSESVLY